MSEARKLAWESMLDAEMALRYWGKMARKYRSWEKVIKILLAVCTSGTVAGWGIWTSHEFVWKFFSGLSAVVAIALPILDYSKMVETMIDLRGKCSEISGAYDLLWAQYGSDPNGPPIREMTALKQKETDLSSVAGALPHDTRLVKESQKEVRHSRGLDKSESGAKEKP
jgi:hypothetical protein